MSKLYLSSRLAIKEPGTNDLEAPSDETSEASHETTEAPASLVAPPPWQHPPAPEEGNKAEKPDRDDDDDDDDYGDAAAAGSSAPPPPPLTFKDQARVSPNDPRLQREPRITADPAAVPALLPDFKGLAFKDQARASPNDPQLQREPRPGEPPAVGPAVAPVLLPGFKDQVRGPEQRLGEQTTIPSAEAVPIILAEDEASPSVHAILLPYDEPPVVMTDGETSRTNVQKRLVWGASFAFVVVVISVIVAVVLSSSSNDAPTMARTGAVEDKLIASDGTADDWFGHSVAISGDTIVVGACYDDVNGTNSGSAYIYTRLENMSMWTQQAKLTASDGVEDDEFGWSVAIDADTVVIGADWDSHINRPHSGSAYIFTRNSTMWTEQAKLIASDGEDEDEFGCSVAISEDTVVIGARFGGTVNKEGNITYTGNAYIYTRSGNLTWTEQAKLMASDLAEYDEFGKSVAVDGDIVAVGAVWDDIEGFHSGSTYIYSRLGNLTWTQQAKLIARVSAEYDEFGRSVAISGDTVLVGASGEDGTAHFGSAYIYIFSNTTWTEQARLMASDGARDDLFGWSAAIDEETAVIGSKGDDDIGINSGSTYIYTRLGATWTEQAKLTAADGTADDEFGHSVAISGATVVIGAKGDDDNGSASGSSYVANL